MAFVTMTRGILSSLYPFNFSLYCLSFLQIMSALIFRQRETNSRQNLSESSVHDCSYKSGANHLTEFIGAEPSKKRKRRTSFTPQALELLNAHFDTNTHPSGKKLNGSYAKFWTCRKFGDMLILTNRISFVLQETRSRCSPNSWATTARL